MSLILKSSMLDLSNENMIHIKKENIEYLQFKKLLEYPEIKHIYSVGIDRDYRTSKPNKEPLENDKYKRALENYRELCKEIDDSKINLVQANQTHSDNIAIIKRSQLEDNQKGQQVSNLKFVSIKDTDSLITNERNIMIATTNADCILLLLYDPKKKVIANVHSGWRGTVQRISVKTVEKMKKTFNSDPRDIICCICPSIRKCHFEVGEEVKEIFQNEFHELNLKNIIEKAKNEEKWYIDTVEINNLILQKAGLRKENIIDSKLCSVCNHNIIHSYRKEKEGYGVSTALIEIGI